MDKLMQRTILFEGREIIYQLEAKPVQNINLRIRKDGTVFVSANPAVPAAEVDAFVCRKGNYVLNAVGQFQAQAQYRPQPKQYVSGETFYIQGRGIRLRVSQATKDSVHSDGVYMDLALKNPEDFEKKKRLVERYLDQQCRSVFGEIMDEIYPVFRKYGIGMPRLRIRNMETRWGSCTASKGTVTLNKRLLEAPRNCIEYVVTHEFCHFIHPNHSRQFYSFLTTLMPDWKERKALLDKNAEYWL